MSDSAQATNKGNESGHTPWFPSKTKPARVGWYEVRCTSSAYPFQPGEKRMWMGSAWQHPPKARAEFDAGCRYDEWRGLRAPASIPSSQAGDQMNGTKP